MAKFTIFIFIIFLAAMGYLAILNNEPVTLKLSEQTIYQVPWIALIIMSSVFGAGIALTVVAFRDAKRYIENWQSLRQNKKDLKIQEAYSKGLDAFFGSRYEEATEFFNRILEEEPLNVNALLRRGDIAFETGDFISAKEFYFKAKEIRPQSVEVLLSLEKVFESEEKWQEALRYLDNILESDDENPEALYRKREIYEKTRKWEALLDVQYKILKSDIPDKEKQQEHKNLLGYKYELGRFYLERGERDKAKKILRNIIRVNKDFVAAYLALAESYSRDNDTDEAENLLMKGYEVTASLVFLARLEDFYIDIGEPGRIIDIYQKGIQKNPRDTKLQFLLAKLYYRLEMIDYAFEAITGIDTTAVDYPDAHILLGNIYKRRMQYDKAAEEFRRALTKPEKPLIISSYCCPQCGYNSLEWNGRCPDCKQWNTMSLDLDGTCKV
ncbi:MAG: tetratricopeptide repeat protein [Nitrospirae bacterium]|nr:tetratricopeptide repeat protein [Nitrospirota bacterium]